ncbi:hypothetical protein CAEBREN_03653 [Caenorhabditis brenneri]|uniref:Uncharacterized protein n=1 Tax=Caenorhabditis brenneri TaxID=135651 RepID=G0P2J0_CAEBE|nr:hypothetical protein CAEBREN_03653 [Caenorhabditis brenneri]
MRLLVPLLLCVTLAVHASFVEHPSFVVPRPYPILSHTEFVKAANKPGLFAWRFMIPDDSMETTIDLQGVEWLSRLAEKKRSDLVMRLQVDQNRNISLSFNKCGFKSTVSTFPKKREVIIVSPSFFTSFIDAGLIGCRKFETPLFVIIGGEQKTTGTISFNFLEDDDKDQGGTDDMFFKYFYPIIAGLFFIIAVIGAAVTVCVKTKCISELNKRYKRYKKYRNFHNTNELKGIIV